MCMYPRNSDLHDAGNGFYEELMAAMKSFIDILCASSKKDRQSF